MGSLVIANKVEVVGEPTARVELTKTARSAYEHLFENARTELASSRGEGIAVQKMAQVDEALDELGFRDPANDIPLAGYLWPISWMVNGQMQLYYSRIIQQRLVLVLHLGELTTSPDSTYELFAKLVLSGKFDQTMARLGILIPKTFNNTAISLRIQ